MKDMKNKKIIFWDNQKNNLSKRSVAVCWVMIVAIV